MANIQSAKKRIRVTESKTRKNKMIKSALKTKIKNFQTDIENKNLDNAKISYTAAIKALDTAASKGIVHKNMVNRKKSKLTKKLNSLSA